jgi:nitrite reductase (NADH) large subunit
MKETRFIIVGNGIAGLSAAKRIRKENSEASIILIGKEDEYPYYRIKLSKILGKNLSHEKLLLENQEWFQQNNIVLKKNAKVLKIDFDEQRVYIENERLEYDKILLACGAREKIPPIKGMDKENVFGLRTLEDAKKIMKASLKSQRILVIGGGILGLEVAYEMNQLSKEVIVIELADRLMPKQLDEETSYLIQEKIESTGVKVKVKTSISELFGQNKVEGYKTEQGEINNIDMVIYSIGIDPNIELFKNTKLKMNQGVCVNNKMETNIPNVYAAGDVAEFQNEVQGLWQVAAQQGNIAGSNMSGIETVYEPKAPVVLLNAFDLALFSIGTVQKENIGGIIQSEKKSECHKLFFEHHTLIGSILIGNISNSTTIKSAIDREIFLPEIDSKWGFEETIELIKEKVNNEIRSDFQV